MFTTAPFTIFLYIFLSCQTMLVFLMSMHCLALFMNLITPSLPQISQSHPSSKPFCFSFVYSFSCLIIIPFLFKYFNIIFLVQVAHISFHSTFMIYFWSYLSLSLRFLAVQVHLQFILLLCFSWHRKLSLPWTIWSLPDYKLSLPWTNTHSSQ